MLTNLNRATASMDRTMRQVEAMMTNLSTVGADPQTAENLRLTLANIKDTSDRIAHMAENLDSVAGDPQTAADLKETIRNARKMSDKAGDMMGKLETIKVKPAADILYSGAKDDWQTDFNVDIGPETGNYLSLGLDDIGEGNRGNLQVGRRGAHFGVRGGVINGDPGVGLDAYAGTRFQFSADAYDFDDPSCGSGLSMNSMMRGPGSWASGMMSTTATNGRPTWGFARRFDRYNHLLVFS